MGLFGKSAQEKKVADQLKASQQRAKMDKKARAAQNKRVADRIKKNKNK